MGKSIRLIWVKVSLVVTVALGFVLILMFLYEFVRLSIDSLKKSVATSSSLQEVNSCMIYIY